MKRLVAISCCGVAALAFGACERSFRNEDGQTPTYVATIDVSPQSMLAGSDLRQKLSAFAERNGLKPTVLNDMSKSGVGAAVLLIDEPKCFSFQIVASGSPFDLDHVQLTLHQDKQATCRDAAEPRAIWQNLLEEARTAKEVSGVRDGVLEWTPSTSSRSVLPHQSAT